MGVNLAVSASAWEGMEDRADLFIYWNGVAYGRDRFGDEARAGLASRLKHGGSHLQYNCHRRI